MYNRWEDELTVNTFYNINDLMLGILKPVSNVMTGTIEQVESEFKYVTKVNKNNVPQILNFTTEKKVSLNVLSDVHAKFVISGLQTAITIKFVIPYLNLFLNDTLDYCMRHFLDEPLSFNLSYCGDNVIIYTLDGVTEDGKFFDYYLNLCNMLNNTNNKTKSKMNNNDISNIRCQSEYFTWRNKVLRRDKDKCVLCGFKKHLHVHHIFSLNEYPELATDTGNGITLCKYCHNKLHSDTNKKKVTPMDLVNFMKEYC